AVGTLGTRGGLPDAGAGPLESRPDPARGDAIGCPIVPAGLDGDWQPTTRTSAATRTSSTGSHRQDNGDRRLRPHPPASGQTANLTHAWSDRTGEPDSRIPDTAPRPPTNSS